MDQETHEKADKLIKETAYLIHLKKQISTKDNKIFKDIYIKVGNEVLSYTSSIGKEFYYHKFFKEECDIFTRKILRKINSQIKNLEKEYKKL